MSNLELPLELPIENTAMHSDPNSIAEKAKGSTDTKKKTHPILNPLVVMLLLFGLPYVFAWYFLNQDSPLEFASANNQGQLVSPMIPLGEFQLDLLDGATITSAQLAGNWTLITVTDSCDLTCQQTLFTIRQARKSTGINRKVITPIIIESVPNAIKAFDADLSQAFPKLLVAKSNIELLSQLAKVHPELSNTIYMIDPYGNLMMYYPAGATQKGLMYDLERLLKVNKPKL